MCTGCSLIAGVALARLPYVENPVSGDLLGAREDVCAQAVPVCGVRKCCVRARRESGQQHGFGEAVSGAAGGRRPLVGSPSAREGGVRGGRMEGWAMLCLAAVLGRVCVNSWAGAASGMLLRWPPEAFDGSCVEKLRHVPLGHLGARG
jgi:hypothetical protein